MLELELASESRLSDRRKNLFSLELSKAQQEQVTKQVLYIKFEFTIDTSGNVGIGTSSPDTLLELSKAAGTGTSLVKLANTSGGATSNIAQIDFELSNTFSGANVDVQIGAIKTNAGNEESAFYINTTSGTGTPTERMRIDSSGNVGIGTTADIATSSSSSSTGFWLSSSDYLAVARNQQRAAIFNRIGNDGEVVAIRKDGSTVGNIGVHSGTTYIQGNSNSSGFLFGNSNVYPWDAGALSDANIELGSSDYRWNNLYLSGSVTTGAGTAASPAIKVGDSDTGIWHPADNILAFSTWGSERLRVDPYGNCGIGTTSPTEKLTVNGALAVTGALADDRTSTAAMDFSGGVTRFISYGASGTGGQFAFRTASGGASSTERMRIDSSGLLQIGTTGKTGRLNLQPNPSNNHFVEFYNTSDVKVGEINTTGGTTTNYVTSSDYRLKENVDYDFNALDRVAQLKPARFNFITNADTTVDGFLAHEVQDIVPESVTGMLKKKYEITY